MAKNYIARMREKVGHDGMIFVSAFGVLQNDAHDAILLEKRWDSDEGWGFPGGYLEYGDSPMQAVKREFKEETNLDVKVTRMLGIATNEVKKILGVMHKKPLELVLKLSMLVVRC